MIDSTLMLTIFPCERVISYKGKNGVMNIAALTSSSFFLIYSPLPLFFAD